MELREHGLWLSKRDTVTFDVAELSLSRHSSTPVGEGRSLPVLIVKL